jgi:hypothetical protein
MEYTDSRRVFTNTYVTGSGRSNYLRIDHLEDPLFASFTFDIDFVTSPLFYTINYSDYGYPEVEGMADNIELALKDMYANNISQDQGYDILPVLSASILDGNKLGFGIQQNVYMDTPLYGATEYIYMVDKRNGSSGQNDARFDTNRFAEFGGNPNDMNSFKLGDSIKDIVSESDKLWAERNMNANKETIDACADIMASTSDEHQANVNYVNDTLKILNDIKGEVVEGGEEKSLTEAELQQRVNEYKNGLSEFDKLKREIVEWANRELLSYKNRGTSIYDKNKCIQKISKIEDLGEETKNKYNEELKKQFGDNFAEKYLFTDSESYAVKFNELYNELFKNFLIDTKNGVTIKKEFVVNRFSDKLKYFGLIPEGSNTYSDEEFISIDYSSEPEWVGTFENAAIFSNDVSKYVNMNEKFINLMTFQFNFSSLEDFGKNSENNISKINDDLEMYEGELEEVRKQKYGLDENGAVGDMTNYDPNSPYGEYIKAKEQCENDEYSQAEKAKSIAQSGSTEMSKMLERDAENKKLMDENYNAAIQKGEQPLEMNRQQSIVSLQTVLDMLGFISGMKKLINQYPYIIQGVTGLDTAYNKHYGIKDPYLGSGEDKITISCFESLDLRVSSMFNRYFNAVYDRQYRRERVPVNLRRFNCSIYVHDVRNFVAKTRLDKYGDYKMTYNRLLELTDMYYSVIEFRFYDCEIIPEETGNIFSDISNEAPSDMKKTDLTFTYGNCVVNFVPYSEVALHNKNN